MDANELHAKVKKQPFEPFQLFVSDGEIYDIQHPDQIMVGRSSSHVGLQDNGDGPFLKIAIVSNIHITRIEPSNGKKRKGRTR